MNLRLRIALFCFAAFTFIGCDRITKDLAREHLANREAISYFHDVFRLQYAENTGAALNLGDDLSRPASFWLLSMLPLVLLLLLFGYTLTNLKTLDSTRSFSFILIFSGGIGNIIDRLLYDRHVPDFLNLGINNFRTGIFNVADICVTLGVIGILYATLRKGPAGKSIIS